MNYLDNLIALREAVANEPEHLFNLGAYESPGTCGTLHCTAGLAATMPFFQQQGLRLISGIPQIPGAAPGWQAPVQYALNTLFKAHPGHSLENDDDVFDYLFAKHSHGLWDLRIIDDLGDVDDKELALARLDKAIQYWESK